MSQLVLLSTHNNQIKTVFYICIVRVVWLIETYFDACFKEVRKERIPNTKKMMNLEIQEREEGGGSRKDGQTTSGRIYGRIPDDSGHGRQSKRVA